MVAMDSLVSLRKGLRITHDAEERLRRSVNEGRENSSRGVGSRAAAYKGTGAGRAYHITYEAVKT